MASLEGVDGAEETDGIKSGDDWFKGCRFDDLPSTYVVGDTKVYSQRYKDVDITFDGLLDLDQEYPWAEYYLGDSVRKWVRRIRQVTMNRQLFPIYTSMEGMKVSPEDITEEQLKEITF